MPPRPGLISIYKRLQLLAVNELPNLSFPNFQQSSLYYYLSKFYITVIDLQTVVELTHSMIIYLAPIMSH